MAKGTDERRWSVAEAALFADVSATRIRADGAKGTVVVDDDRLSDDDVIRLAALERFSGGGWLADRRMRRTLRDLVLPATPYFLMCYPTGEVIAVDPDRILRYVSRSGEFRGFDPAPIRQRMGLAWAELPPSA